MKRQFVLLPMLAVAACATPQPATPIETPTLGEGGCDADTLGYLVGQDIGEIDTATLPRPHRIIRPGMAVTMDYREDRTNLELDETGQVVRVFCG
ncbi:I78 family peptidase inhibitor [Hyphobacterium sp.]|uniref:I78 family peptidase inhibitor n=1 Tax=Hyphobacterium sp. TaxID=2004662 RepID=UPI003B51A658